MKIIIINVKITCEIKILLYMYTYNIDKNNFFLKGVFVSVIFCKILKIK